MNYPARITKILDRAAEHQLHLRGAQPATIDGQTLHVITPTVRNIRRRCSVCGLPMCSGC